MSRRSLEAKTFAYDNTLNAAWEPQQAWLRAYNVPVAMQQLGRALSLAGNESFVLERTTVDNPDFTAWIGVFWRPTGQDEYHGVRVIPHVSQRSVSVEVAVQDGWKDLTDFLVGTARNESEEERAKVTPGESLGIQLGFAQQLVESRNLSTSIVDVGSRKENVSVREAIKAGVVRDLGYGLSEVAPTEDAE